MRAILRFVLTHLVFVVVLYVCAIVMDFFFFDFSRKHELIIMWAIGALGFYLNIHFFYTKDILGVEKKKIR